LKLDQLMDTGFLATMVEEGYVRQQHHPFERLTILNYTAAAQWDRLWNEVTLQCRGLIVDGEGNVVARPWPKFFNYGEHPEGSFDLNAAAKVTDKMDGSLGILYRCESGQLMIATRGSFTSEQATVGSLMLLKKYQDFEPQEGVTYLFEIIYPENRIVVDYQGREELVLLDVLWTDTGLPVNRDRWQWDFGWHGPKVEVMPAETLGEALALPPRPNAEGMVVRFVDGTMIKLKQEDYVALHRLVTGLNEKTVWEHLAAGGTVPELLAPLPEEFHPWVTEVADELCADRAVIEGEALLTFGELQHFAHDRKSFALEAVNEENPQLLFMLLDGKDIEPATWKLVKPKVTRTLLTITEDTA